MSEKNSLDFHDTFEQVSIQFVKKKLILFRVTSHLDIILLSFNLDFTVLFCPLMNEKVHQSSLYVV